MIIVLNQRYHYLRIPLLSKEKVGTVILLVTKDVLTQFLIRRMKLAVVHVMSFPGTAEALTEEGVENPERVVPGVAGDIFRAYGKSAFVL